MAWLRSVCDLEDYLASKVPKMAVPRVASMAGPTADSRALSTAASLVAKRAVKKVAPLATLLAVKKVGAKVGVKADPWAFPSAVCLVAP